MLFRKSRLLFLSPFFVALWQPLPLRASPLCVDAFTNGVELPKPPSGSESLTIELGRNSAGQPYPRFRTSEGGLVTPLMNAKSLTEFTAKGGAPKSSILDSAPEWMQFWNAQFAFFNPAWSLMQKSFVDFWSSKDVLEKVLSLDGPLGNKGPLSKAGPIGDDSMHPSDWIRVFSEIYLQPGGPWQKTIARLKSNVWTYGAGLGLEAWTEQSLRTLRHLDPTKGTFSPLNMMGPLAVNFHESVYSILGSAGPLGALAMGPDGPLGLLELRRGIIGPDANGEYHDKTTRALVESIPVSRGNGLSRTYRIFKNLSASMADQLSRYAKLDTSFLVDDTLPKGSTAKTYHLTCPDLPPDAPGNAQLVSFLVIPDVATREDGTPVNFDLRVMDRDGHLLLESTSRTLANFVQLQVTPGIPLRVEIRSQSSDSPSSGYRLVVVGDPYFDLEKEGTLRTPQALSFPTSGLSSALSKLEP